MATNLGDETEPHFYYTVRGEKNSNRVPAVVTLSPEDYSIVTVGVRMNGMWWSTNKYDIIAKTQNNRFPQVTFRWSRPAWAPKFPNKLEFASLSISRSKMAFFSYDPEETETRHLHNISEAEAEKHDIPASLKDRSIFGGRAFSFEIDTAKKDAKIIRESRIQEFLLSVPVRTDAEIEAATPKGPRWHVSNGRRSMLV